MSKVVQHKVIIHGPPIVDEGFVQTMFGTDIRGLADRIRQGEYDHIIYGEESETNVKPDTSPGI